MSKIVEIYPDVEELELQVEARKAFGWDSEISITDRGVYEVTFTRDDTKAKNKKLGALEADFDQCFAASDYIERYGSATAKKERFRAFSPLMMAFLIYVMVQFGALGLMSFLIAGMYKVDPSILEQAGVNFTVGEYSQTLTPDFTMDLNLEEMGLTSIAEMLGYTEPVFTVTTDFIMGLLFAYGILGTILLVAVIVFMIFRKKQAKAYFRAEEEYIAKRKELLMAKYDELEARMDDIMEEVARVRA